MARRLKNWPCLEVQTVIRFLWAKNVSASKIHSQIVEVNGEEAMSRQLVAKWCRSFQSYRKDIDKPTTKKFKVTPSVGKFMATILWDSCGVILIEYLERSLTINADSYCANLTRLHEVIRRKRPSMLSEGPT